MSLQPAKSIHWFPYFVVNNSNCKCESWILRLKMPRIIWIITLLISIDHNHFYYCSHKINLSVERLLRWLIFCICYYKRSQFLETSEWSAWWNGMFNIFSSEFSSRISNKILKIFSISKNVPMMNKCFVFLLYSILINPHVFIILKWKFRKQFKPNLKLWLGFGRPFILVKLCGDEFLQTVLKSFKWTSENVLKFI